LVSKDRPIVYGILMPGRGFRDGVPVIKVKDIRDGRIDTTDLLLTDPRIDEAYRRARVRTGDLLFTIRGTVGRMAFVPPELNNANITQDTARVSLQDANPVFIARWLESRVPARFIDVHTIGVAVRGINLGEVRRIPVVVPPREEQAAIAAIISTAEERVEAEEGVLECLLKLKSGLMTDLLTGRVRVPPTTGGNA
jgi:type I restriction enzyme S subunit